jgi:hypothetical protein
MRAATATARARRIADTFGSPIDGHCYTQCHRSHTPSTLRSPIAIESQQVIVQLGTLAQPQHARPELVQLQHRITTHRTSCRAPDTASTRDRCRTARAAMTAAPTPACDRITRRAPCAHAVINTFSPSLVICNAVAGTSAVEALVAAVVDDVAIALTLCAASAARLR